MTISHTQKEFFVISSKEYKHMKKFKQYMVLLGCICLLASCTSWMTINPENAQTSDEYWQSKEEVAAVLMSGYSYLRSSVEYMYLWGESRGNGIEFNNITTSTTTAAAYKLRTMDILPSNAMAKWACMYKIINMANSVIKYAPDVQSRDASFTSGILNSYLSEAYFLRSLSYYYLVRTFRDVPFVTVPYVTDDASYDIAQTAGSDILKQLVTDLTNSLDAAKKYFPGSDGNYSAAYTKGRATKWAIEALLADIYLWQGNYADCITACDAVINSGYCGLISGDNWFTNFYPGNSNESIFEIQYDNSLSQTNDFITWFYTDKRYLTSTFEYSLFETADLRGIGTNSTGASFTSGLLIWKYIGTDITGNQRSTSTQNDQNFIIYRIADIYLMKAEAQIMQGNMTDAAANINKIRERAGLSDITAVADESTMLDMLLAEREREFFSEGKNWFDILRVAQRDDCKYKQKLIDQVLEAQSARNQAIVSSKLYDTNSWYMPIASSELKVNSLLIQNSYYANLGN
jgi:starch-binding outer membrane protein, SusD/RagB family